MTSPRVSVVDPDVVQLDLAARSGEEAVRVLHARLLSSPAVVDGARFLREVFARMQLGPVCIADEIALPHARTDAVNRLTIAVGRAKEGFAFDAEHPQVRLVFLIGTPKEAATDYLRTVANLTRLLRDPMVRGSLLTTDDEAEFRALLAGRVAARQ
jgi:mannitol/fructose-specific phosphotransferase system IIA component (Ntr-type)